MHRRTAVTLATLVAVLLLAGCQGKELTATLRVYTLTMDKLSDAREAGKISDKTQTEVIAPARDATKAILDEAVDAYVRDTPFDIKAALQRAWNAMAPLLRQREVIEAMQ